MWKSKATDKTPKYVCNKITQLQWGRGGGGTHAASKYHGALHKTSSICVAACTCNWCHLIFSFLVSLSDLPFSLNGKSLGKKNQPADAHYQELTSYVALRLKWDTLACAFILGAMTFEILMDCFSDSFLLWCYFIVLFITCNIYSLKAWILQCCLGNKWSRWRRLLISNLFLSDCIYF